MIHAITSTPKDSGIRFYMQSSAQQDHHKIASRTLLLSVVVTLITLIQGCSFPGVYKINVQQGNIVSQEMLNQLRPGMTKRQVHFVLGNPVVKNVFNTDQEHYLYSYQKAGEDTQTQSVVIYYSDGLYERYEGEVLEDQPAY